jgi:hypothetical protein
MAYSDVKIQDYKDLFIENLNSLDFPGLNMVMI